MSTVVFDQDGLKVIRFCGKPRSNGESRVRFQLIRSRDEIDELGDTTITLSEKQMKALVTSDLAADLCHDTAMSLLGMPPGNDYHGHSCRKCADDGPEHAGDHSCGCGHTWAKTSTEGGKDAARCALWSMCNSSGQCLSPAHCTYPRPERKSADDRTDAASEERPPADS